MAISVPFLNPFAPGPSPYIVPWLVGGTCIAVLVASYNPDSCSAVVWGWVCAALVGAVMGLMQYFGWASSLAPWISSASAGEAYGNLRQRNQFATMTNIGLASLLWCIVKAADDGASKKRHVISVAGLLGLVLLIWANAASSSRTGFLQLLIVALLGVVWHSRLRSRTSAFRLSMFIVLMYFIAALALPLLLVWSTGVAGPNVFMRLAESEGCSSRTVLWSNVIDLIEQRPWTGWGWGNLDYAHYATLYSSERFCGILDNAHNLPLHLAVELGLPVAAAYCGLIVWWILASAPWRAVHPTHQLAWTVIAVIGLHSLLEYPLWYAPFLITLVMCFAFLHQPAAENAELRPQWLRAFAAVVILGLVAVSARDYFRVSQLYLHPDDRSRAGLYFTTTDLDRLTFFHDQAEFAHLSTTPLTRENAAAMAKQAERLLRYSPEPRVIEMLIESLTLSGEQSNAVRHLARYRAAFPSDYEAWKIKANLAGTAVRVQEPKAP